MSTRSSMGTRAVLVACLIALSACTCAPPMRLEGPQPVNIQVVWKPATSGIFVFPNSARLGEGRDYPVWVLVGAPEDADLFIEFKDGSPLEDDPPAASSKGPSREAGKGHVVKKGKPKKGTAGKAYKYEVIVKIGNESHRLDPFIEVDR